MPLFIDTKFQTPVLLPRLVVRQNLLTQLDRVMEGRLAVVSAPAGFGKTTLLGQWCLTAQERGIEVAWLSLDERENEPGRLLDHIIGALKRVSERIVENLPSIVDTNPTLPTDVILTRLINGITAWKGELVLVIDDAHFLTDPEIGVVLDALLAYAPRNFRILLATRGAIPVKVATLRMRGLMVRLDETSLRFSLEEASSFLNDCRGLSLDEPEILALQNRTEGWIAALQLASLALTESEAEARARFLAQFSGSSGDIAEFLLQDVIGRLPPELLDFLLRSAILDWFDADLAAAVSGQADARSRQACLQARDSHTEAQSVFGIVYSDLILGLIEKAAGNLTLAGDHFQRATRRAYEALGPDSYAEAMAGIFRVELLYEWNELAEAEALLLRHRPLIEEAGLVVHDIACKMHVARLAAAQSRADEALAVLERAERQGVKNRYRRLAATAINDRVRLLILRGEPSLARHVLAARGISEDWARTDAARRPACEMEHIALARLLIAENRPEAAIRLLDSLGDKVRAEGRMRRLAQIRAVTAIACFRTGDGLATLAAIVDAVEICRRQGALRTLIDEGEPLREVLLFGREKVPSWRSRSEVAGFLDRIVGVRPSVDPARRSLSARPRFSPKETEVARRLSEGLTNRDLSTALDMAPDTVKWHLKNIFSKLGVENRTQAVLRLREMGVSQEVSGG